MTPVLETDRLILRPLTVKDAPAVFKWTSDERVAKYMIYQRHENIETTIAWLESIKDASEDSFHWGFVLKENGRLIGSGSIKYRKEEKCWSFGYNISYDCWNRGYTTEAAKRMIEFAYKEHGARDFISEHAVDNPASGRVMEKCGLKFLHFGQYTKLDGSETVEAKVYKMHID
ncbi:GNAT family N-acetyltransferase [Ruminococcus sp. Marseille-P6503]|uniref:GNAT family N-acetyltransferase n=1 Tax=Ruminococcus sp. Marseille-P6503 TaxID=2364796 RepID=UPI000F549CA1|nr:GNAT family N-acetyltransferase [Ruminococcus sp. Marseille-P6503]